MTLLQASFPNPYSRSVVKDKQPVGALPSHGAADGIFSELFRHFKVFAVGQRCRPCVRLVQFGGVHPYTSQHGDYFRTQNFTRRSPFHSCPKFANAERRFPTGTVFSKTGRRPRKKILQFAVSRPSEMVRSLVAPFVWIHRSIEPSLGVDRSPCLLGVVWISKKHLTSLGTTSTHAKLLTVALLISTLLVLSFWLTLLVLSFWVEIRHLFGVTLPH